MTSASTSGPLPNIPGFKMVGVLGHGATSVVFHGLRDGNPYAIKMMRKGSDKSELGANLRFRREASALARFTHPSLVRIFEVDEFQGQAFIVMELVEGKSLAARLADGPLSEPDLLAVAKSVAAALTEVHRRGLVHRDIKPANMIFDRDGRAKVIDFGFVVQASDGTEGVTEDAAGTFLYSAPEQTGMLKRPVDGRSDLYALGVVLFECATGRPPFQATAVSELLRQHMAVKPPHVHELNPNVRPSVGDIVAKLLAKDPDDRYQTADGLLSDLEQLATLDAMLASGRPSLLGARDAQVRLASEIPLVGRQNELAVLESAWARARAGRGGFVQVEGEGGLGKTRLVRELVQRARNEGALVLMGKGQQIERAPFGVLREAIDDYVGRTMRLPEAEREASVAVLREAAGDFGSILKRLTSSFDAILGDTPDIRPLPPADEQARFYAKITDFLVNLGMGVGSGVFVIDDVQWIDDGTVEILRRLVRAVADMPILILATARNDAASLASKATFVQRIGEDAIERIVLEPLGPQAVADLVAAHLGGKKLDDAFVTRLNARANGNPFAVGEYLRSMLELGMLRPTFAGWVVDAERFHELSLPSDVVQLIVNRIKDLGAETAGLLSAAAILGFEFTTALLADTSGVSVEAVHRAVHEGSRHGLLERAGHMERADQYRFVHDRVHEALLARLGEDERRDLEQAAATALAKVSDPTPEMVLALSRHYANGHVEKNTKEIYATSLRAGLHALDAFSNEEAHELLRRALTFAEKTELTRKEQMAVHEALGAACTRTGRHETAHEHYAAALVATSEKEDRSRIHYLVGQAYATEGKPTLAIKELNQALHMEGAGMPKALPTQVLTLLWHWAWALFMTRFGVGYGRAKGEERRRRATISAIHSMAQFCCWFLSDPLLLTQLTVRELHNVQYLGATPQTAKAHAFYSLLLGLLGFKKAQDHHGKLGVALARQLGDLEALGSSEEWAAVSTEFAGDNVRSQPLAREATKLARKYVNAFHMSALMAHYGYSLSFQGKAREAIEWIESVLPDIERGGNLAFHSIARGILYSQLTVLGRVSEAMAAREKEIELASVATFPWLETLNKMHGLMAAVEQEEFGADVEPLITRVTELNVEDYHVRPAYLLIAHVRFEQHVRAKKEDAAATRKLLMKALGRANAPPVRNRPVFVCHVHAIRAALARHEGDLAAAKSLLERAQEQATISDNLWMRWYIDRERARIAHAENDAAGAERHAKAALTLARTHGWQNRIQQIEREFSVTVDAVAMSRSSLSTTFQVSSSRRLLEVERHMEALLQVSLASSSSLDPVEQAQAALDELVRVLGAERGFLFLNDGAGDAKGSTVRMLAARDAAGKDLPASSGYATTVVEKVNETLAPVVITGTQEGEVLGSESAVALNLRSIIAVPLLVRNELIGAVYLDSSLAKGLFTTDHLKILVPISNQVAIALRVSASARIEAQHLALEKELALTAAVQTLFLPKESATKTAKLGLAGFYRPAMHCSGDWWYWYRRPNGALRVLLGDVTGHGAASAMVAATVATTFELLRDRGEDADVPRVLGTMHQRLKRSAAQMTMSVVEVDALGTTIRWWNAGAPPLLVMSREGTTEVVRSKGTPLGSAHELLIGQKERPLHAGDRVFVFTDGLYEMMTPGERQLGMRRLQGSFQDTRKVEVASATSTLMTTLDGLRQGVPQDDDMTFAMLDVL